MNQALAAHLAEAQALESAADFAGAVLAYDAALAEAPDLAEAHYNRANLLRRAGRAEEALAGYDQALKRRPAWGAAHLNRGGVLAEQGNTKAAVACYRIAAGLEPENAAAWGNLGKSLSALGRHSEAIAALQTATMLRPSAALGHFNLGNALAASGRIADAASALLRAVTLDPGMAPAAVNLSSRMRELGASDAALETARLAVGVAPSLPQGHAALANALYDVGAFAESEASHRWALTLDPGCAPEVANLALVVAAQGRLEEAAALYDVALMGEPGQVQARFGRATTWLARGDFARGWEEFSVRAQMPEAKTRHFAQPLWRGENISGKTILLHAEQGFGDTLQFVRFAPRIAEDFGARVILEVQPRLLRLLKTLPGIARIIPRGAKPKKFDVQCPLMDLGAVFAPTPEALAPAHSYLMADADLVAARRLPPADGALRVGLVWAGQSRADLPHAFAMDRRRSVPLAAFAGLAPVCRAGRIRLFGLQVGLPVAQLAAAPAGLDIFDALSGVTDFAETAAVIAQLDLVIAVDTSTAHLAAAMGKPTWLLCRSDACWRWLRDRDDSPWYPSMTIFRQETANAWGAVIERIVARLEKKELLF